MVTFTQGCYMLPATTHKWAYINEQIGMKWEQKRKMDMEITFATVRGQKL